MNDRERLNAIMSYEEFDRLPVWFFGLWNETYRRWRSEGLESWQAIPEATGMDEAWETGLWNSHDIINHGPIREGQEEIREDAETYVVKRTALGHVIREGKEVSYIPHYIEHALKPTRQSWNEFRKMLDPVHALRYAADWREKARKLSERERVATFLGGSLFSWPREWMGIEVIGYLVHDDPILYEEIIKTLSEHFIAIWHPVLEAVKFDFAYFFEDCCFNNGPLFSPDVYRKHYHRYYKRMIDFYHEAGIPFVLVDSDGKVDDLIPCWLESGFDIVFPIEVGTWKAAPAILRKRFGSSLRMLGGVDKHVIARGEKEVREHLMPLCDLVSEGGFIPIPDHRIPPDCSLDDFRTYVRVFNEVFDG
jgi:uroporphyrinogen decarboxylase